MNTVTRGWIGVTLFLILIINYVALGLPLINRVSYISDRSREIVVKQVRTNSVLKNKEDDYLLDVLRKEKSSIDIKILILNLASASLGIVIVSWTLFGLVGRKEE